MNYLRNSEQLRADLFPSRSGEILRATIQAGRARRRNRGITQIAIAALLVASVSVPLGRRAPAPVRDVIVAKATPHATVLRSKPFTARILSAAVAPPLKIVTQNSVEGFTTASFQPSVRPINDDQLLSFFQGKAVAILRPTPHHAELLFPQ